MVYGSRERFRKRRPREAPQLAAATNAARKRGAAVLVAKLDRLSRDVHSISWTKSKIKASAAAGAAANRDAALERPSALKLHLADSLAGGRSLRSAAEWLNERGVESPGGAKWHAPSLLNAARRLGLK
jgi:hypothetical protein